MGTGLSGSLGSAGGTMGLNNPGGLFQPKQFSDFYKVTLLLTL